MEQIIASAHKVNHDYYSRIVLPAIYKTRNRLPPIINIPLEKRKLSIKYIMSPDMRVFNAQDFKSSLDKV